MVRLHSLFIGMLIVQVEKENDEVIEGLGSVTGMMLGV